MEKQLVIPAVLYVHYMWALALWTFWVRYQGVKSKAITYKNLRYMDGEFPEKLITTARHFDNQFQAPILFLIATAAIAVMKHANMFSVVCAWAFVATRLGHSYEHLGKNRVPRRVLWFASGWFFISALWIQFLYFAMNRGAWPI